MTDAGVCSGTPKMVERSLQAFVYGAEHAEDELLVEALGDVDAAIDYALHASLADLCRWACRVRMQMVTAKALATGAGRGREEVEQLRECCARASEECGTERELQFIEEQRQAIAKMGPGLSRPVDPGEPPGLREGRGGALRRAATGVVARGEGTVVLGGAPGRSKQAARPRTTQTADAVAAGVGERRRKCRCGVWRWRRSWEWHSKLLKRFSSRWRGPFPDPVPGPVSGASARASMLDHVAEECGLLIAYGNPVGPCRLRTIRPDPRERDGFCRRSIGRGPPKLTRGGCNINGFEEPGRHGSHTDGRRP